MTTPREPDRFEAQAREILRETHANPAQVMWLLPYVMDGLRAAESSALERAAQVADRYKSGVAILIAGSIRALIPPAAAPAGEPHGRSLDSEERAEMFQRDARRSDAALVAEKARAEKAEAALEAENLGAKAEQGRLADALAAANARAEKAEADEAIAWSEVHDHEAVIRNFEKSVDKLEEAIVAEKARADRLQIELDHEKAKQALWLGNIRTMERLVKELTSLFRRPAE